MRFVLYSDWSQLPESAAALFAQAEKDSIFFSRAWFECLTATALEDDHRMALACVVSGDKVMAILPLMEGTANKSWYALRHGFTPLHGLLLADDDQERVLSFLAKALSQSSVNGLLLEPIDDDDGDLNRLQGFLETSGFSCEHIFRSYNWIYRLHGKSYADYMAGRPAQLRNTISRKARKLERNHGYEIRLFTGNEVPRHMRDYYVVYNASWKQNDLKNAAFQECFVENFSRAGWSRLAILYIKEQPVAAQLWFVHGGKASIFRLAYDKAWGQYSPGTILTRFLMAHVIDTDRVEEIDFLTGNEAYKQDWMSERRERFLLCCVKRASAETGFIKLVESLKHRLKRR